MIMWLWLLLGMEWRFKYYKMRHQERSQWRNFLDDE